MESYAEKDILRIAKRFNNTKRTYLLVNPLQAKHIPVSPSESLKMMRTLGDQLVRKYPNAKLVIGLAETATAIGVAVAERFSSNCIYIHTTRENEPSVLTWINFQEEHSHATEQKLVGDSMSNWIAATDTIIIVDDEISTGRTLVSMVEQLKSKFPAIATKKIIAASLLNRVSPENEKLMQDAGIISEYMVKLATEDYSGQVASLNVNEAERATPVKRSYRYQALFCNSLRNPRLGVYVQEYTRNCNEVAETFALQFAYRMSQGSSILVIGTEECMYPALKIGEALEHIGLNYNIRCHATTRSPIGICKTPDYPIFHGSKVKSFYADDRDTYIYNLDNYDTVIIVSDTALDNFTALDDLVGALPNPKECKVYYVKNGKSVWCSEE